MRHIHHAGNKVFNGIMYYNCGDWVESCTVLVEDEDGDIQIIHWRDVEHQADNVISLDTHRARDVVNARTLLR